jgi:oligoendopeptidase F
VDHGQFEVTRWNLKNLLPAHAGPELERNLSELEQKVKAFEELRPKLNPDLDVEDFYEMLEQYEDVYVRAVRLIAYAQLWFTEDTQSQEALGFMGRMDALTTDVQNRTLFFSLWWKGLEDPAADRLAAASGDYRYYLESMRRFKPHTLSEAEEKVINIKDVNGMNAMLTLYSMITNKFTYELEVDGEKKTMTREELMAYTRHPDPNARAAVYQELYSRVYKEHANELGQIYNYRVRDWYAENMQLRHHRSPISVRNLGNDKPDEATDALLEVSRANVGLFQRYFQLKARWLGM